MKKTILISGTSTGIGRAMTILFASKGWNVIAGMLEPEKEHEFIHNENILPSKLRLEDPVTIAQTIEAGIAKFGKIDVLANNAGFGQYGLFEALTPEQIKYQFELNVFGTMNVIRAVLPHFRKNKGGMVLNIGSAGGRIGIPLISMYVTSKFALEGFSEAISYELASQNIVVKLVEPGGVDTPFHETAAERYANYPALTDYDAYTTAFNKKFESMFEVLASAKDVAEEAYRAVTDGSDRFRYAVGNDAQDWIKARTSMDDLEYARHMRELFKVDY